VPDDGVGSAQPPVGPAVVKKTAARAAPKPAATAGSKPAKKAAAKAAPKKAAAPRSAVKRAGAKEAAGSPGSSADAPRKAAAAPAAEAVPEAATTPLDGVERSTVLRDLLRAARPRATRAQIVVASLCALLGFGLVTQVRSAAGAGLSTARQSDLVDILDNLSARSDQLRSQIATEQDALGKLTGGTDRTQAALDEAKQRAATLQILAGTVGATGPGIELRIPDPAGAVTAEVLLGALEELRDAGAEAVEIRGAPTASSSATTGSAAPASSASPGTAGSHPAVRLVASSYFVDSLDGHGILVDGTLLMPPYDIYAIGDSHTMTTALGIPGGVLDTLKGKNSNGQVTGLAVVQITALHQLKTPQYARPAASSSAAS
jgi:uncharacterized protein YlxW (UPF0749 family)